MNAEQIIVAATANNVAIPSYVLDVTIESLNKEASAGFDLSAMDTPAKTWLYAYEKHNCSHKDVLARIEKRASSFGILEDIDFTVKPDDMAKEASIGNDSLFSEEVTIVNRFNDKQVVAIRNAADLEKTASYIQENKKHMPVLGVYNVCKGLLDIKDANGIDINLGIQDDLEENTFSGIKICPNKISKIVRAISADSHNTEAVELKSNIIAQLDDVGDVVIDDPEIIANLLQTIQDVSILNGTPEVNNRELSIERLGEFAPEEEAMTIIIGGKEVPEAFVVEKLPEIINALSQYRGEDVSGLDNFSEVEENIALKIIGNY